uniref:coiled-coil domain-containing protein 61 isoform X2 n=1 Tax=Ciona intestinalis TaxID=7719 RepID=UPI00089DD691|nr:coiled-coil domain-containing protein 61 isoform X2 [Ciona intestinalis]|eukprot:XP_018666851.1 coiled-coil domain-containing protein 61 isoform X2 [Ciona intestinalis]
MDEDYTASSEYVFRGIEYYVTIKTYKGGTCLSVEVEDKVTSEQWRGNFDSQYIEDLTHKTGNFKQFSVFVSMLESALEKSTDSVSLDLLTFNDLELLRKRKTDGVGRSCTQPNRQNENKRYLILVYSVEFDRIHYPLPLPFQGKPDPAHLQNLVRKLNEEISKLKSEKGNRFRGDDDGLLRLKEDYESLLQEKKDLESAFDDLKLEIQGSNKMVVTKEVKILKKVVQNLELELMKEKTRYQRQLSKKSTEVKRLNSELSDLSARERTLHIRVKSLTNELAIYKRSRTPVANTRQSSGGRNSVMRNQYSRNSVNRNRPERSLSRGSNSGSFYHRSVSRERVSRNRPPSVSRERSSSRDNRSLMRGNKSRTPTPNRFSRFNPTLYNEERKRKLQESQERMKRRTSAGYVPASKERGRARNRRNSSQDRSLASRRRQGSIESRNSSDNSSITRFKSRRKPTVWDDSPLAPSSVKPHRLSSTPNMERHRVSKVTRDTDIDEIDARLDALQQYMKEMEKK